MIFEVVSMTVPALLNPKMTASWEKGLDGITRGTVVMEDYRSKLEDFIRRETVADRAGSDRPDCHADPPARRKGRKGACGEAQPRHSLSGVRRNDRDDAVRLRVQQLSEGWRRMPFLHRHNRRKRLKR